MSYFCGFAVILEFLDANPAGLDVRPGETVFQFWDLKFVLICCGGGKFHQKLQSVCYGLWELGRLSDDARVLLLLRRR